MNARLAAMGACLLLAGCTKYADFTLPELKAQAGVVSWTWQPNAQPVLGRGPAGEFDAVDTLNPSVVREASGELLNLFSGYDGRVWHTGVAVSRDGVQWVRKGRVLSPDASTWEGDYIAANGTALVDGSRLLYWYQAGRIPRIGLAVSNDGGATWIRHSDPVLPLGPRASWDERGVADPYVVRVGDSMYMYYLGQDRAQQQRIGLARSADGVHWEKLRSNPVLGLGEPGAFDETGLGEPAVWQEQGSYWMLYTARDPKEYRRIGLARSQDGIRWERVSAKPVIAGVERWNSAVVCDPSVLLTSEGARVWFGGGDRPEPAENLHGQIGYGLLRLRVGGI